MHPLCLLSIGGVPVGASILSRLISCTVTDKEGTRADTIDIEIDGGGAVALAIPRTKAIITCALGYEETGASYMGSFTVDEVELSCLPFKLKIQGKSADMRAKLKEHRQRHWDNKTVKDVVSQIASENGLAPQISASAGSYKYKWLGQEIESGLHLVERLARRHNALFAIKDGKLIFTDKGAGLTASGAAVGAIVITPQMIVEGTCSVKFVERPSYSKVRAGWHDQGKGFRQYEEADADAQGQALYTVRHQLADKDEAKNMAKSKAKDLQRSGDTTSVTIEGNPAARGGGGMVYAGVHASVDDLPWIIETATHSYSKGQGYTTQIEAKAKV